MHVNKQSGWIIIVFVLLVNSTLQISAYSIEGSFVDLLGRNKPFSRYEGNYLLVDAMATWCEPCKIEILHLKEIYESTINKMEILSLSVDPETDTINKIQAFKLEFEAEWDFGLDKDFNFANQYKIINIPTLLLMDQNGNLLKKWEGITDTVVILEYVNTNLDLNVTNPNKPHENYLIKQLQENFAFQATMVLIALLLLNKLLVPKKMQV